MHAFYTVRTNRSIPLRLHYTWIIAALVGGWILHTSALPDLLPGLDGLLYLLLTLAGLALGLISVALHELAHILAARSRGIRPRMITLYPFGGVPNHLDQRAGPAATLWIAAAGPAMSLALWWLLTTAADVAALPLWLRAMLWLAAQINLGLALSNLLPGLPLDGGRILRALAWNLTFDFGSATEVARKIGQAIAYGLIFLGAWMIVAWEGDARGLVLLLLGWTMRIAGGLNEQRALVDRMLQNLSAADLALPSVETLSPDATLRQVFTETLQQRSAAAPMPVVAAGQFCGMLTMRDMLEIPQGLWEERTVASAMVPAALLPQIAPDTPVSALVPWFTGHDGARLERLPVVSDGRLVGVLDASRLDAILRLEDALALYGHESDVPLQSRSSDVPLQSGSGAAT